MAKIANIRKFVYSQPWAIRSDKFTDILGVLERKANDIDLSPKEIQAITAIAARPGRPRSANGNIAILPVFGIISHRASMVKDVSEPEGTSTEKLSKQFAKLVDDPSIGAIVLDVSSPGGTVSGVPELAEQIFEARGEKQIIAVANAQAASAAYHIASAASEIVVTPSGEVGSIGVFMAHQDLSEHFEALGVKTTLISAGKFKTEGNPFEPLSEEAAEHFKEEVNKHYDRFVKSVAKFRGVPVSQVRNGFGQGRMVMAAEAVREGMADRVATMDQTIARLTGKSRLKQTNKQASQSVVLEEELSEQEIEAIKAVLEPSIKGWLSAKEGSDTDEDLEPQEHIDLTECRARQLLLLK